MARKLFAAFLVIALLVTGFTAASITNRTTPAFAQSTDTVLLRFVHALPDAEAVDVYVNDGLVVPALAYGQATPHLAFPVGDYTLALRPAGSDVADAAIFSQSFNLAASRTGYRQNTAVIQADEGGNPALAIYFDDLDPATLGFARMHLIHAVAGVAPIDLQRTDGAPILQGVTFNQVSGSVNLPVGNYDLVVTATGDTPENALLAVGNIEVNTNLLYTVIVIGTASGDPAPAALVLTTPFFSNPAQDEILVSIAHGSGDAPTVDVYANDTPILVGLAPGDITPHIPLPVGTVRLSLREAGALPNSAAAFESEVDLSSDSGAATIVALGSLADGTFNFSLFADEIADLDSATARIHVINTVTTGPANLELSDGTTLASALAPFAASNPVDVPAGTYSVTGSFDEEAGPVSINLPDQTFVGGTHYTLLVFSAATPGLGLAYTPINTASNSFTGAAAPEVVAAATEEPVEATPVTTDATPVAVITTPPPLTPIATTPVAVTPPPVVSAPPATQAFTGVVNLDSGVNLQCREYPTSAAFSLGLVPNGSTLILQGFAGPIDPEDGQPNTPLEPGAFDNPELAQDFNEIWLNADWAAPQGGTIRCWVRADFLQITYKGRNINDIGKFFELVELGEIDAVPSNYPGGAVDDSAIVVPPSETAPQLPIATVNVNPGVNLQLRRTPSIQAESLALVPGGTDLSVLSRTEITPGTEIGAPQSPDWYFVQFATPDGSALITGWVSADFVILTFNGRAITAEDVPLAEDPLPVGEILAGSGSPAIAIPTEAPIVGLVSIPGGDGNLNLRDRPSTDGILVTPIPSGSNVVVLGRNGDGTWLNVRYEIAGQGASTGWVATEFVTVTRSGSAFPINTLLITSGEADSMN
ncbi:MAG: hypothetical protein BroJett018_20430 [Chloroflexota bacterium]|nr:DUF4397 domain-containing protein [Chloroflexota bacterium]NOG62554.1 DUF4397 domain-containing protein [Chloroflexota bacterium]GIK64249.1 MAG: hypothetical protein BroJett018_20430 [Chloroflexota bacterium]